MLPGNKNAVTDGARGAEAIVVAQRAGGPSLGSPS